MDQLKDKSGRKLYKLSKEASLPDYALEFPVMRDLSEEPSSSFADQVGREFPVHTREDTLISAAFMRKYGEKVPPGVQKRMDEAVNLWGVQEDLENAFNIQNKEASEEGFEITYPLKTPYKTRITTKDDFEKAAADCTDPSKYPLSVRRDVSVQLLRKTKDYQPSIYTRKKLEKSAGWGTTTPDILSKALRDRGLVLYKHDRERADGLIKAADDLCVRYKYTVPYDVLEKTASFMDRIDRLSGMHRAYDRGLDRPEDSAFRFTVTDGEALNKLGVGLRNDLTIRRGEIEDNFEPVQSFLEDAFDIKVENTKEACEKLPSLTRYQADLLVNTVFSRG